MLKDVSHVMLTKLTRCSALVNTPAAKFAHAIDRRFRTNVISDAELMQQFVTLSGSNGNDGGKTLAQKSAFMDSVLKEDSTDIFVDGQIVRFIRATNKGDKGAHPLL